MKLLRKIKRLLKTPKAEGALSDNIDGRPKDPSPDDTVYCYNYRDLIFITRTRDGRWFYNYTISKIVEHINKNRVDKINLNPLKYHDINDMITLGLLIGSKSSDLIRECKVSYGDLN